MKDQQKDSLVKFSQAFEKPVIVPEEGLTEIDHKEHFKQFFVQSSSSGSNSQLDLDTILRVIIPPREWTHDEKTYIQYVSTIAANREDVILLQKLLDEKLIARQAKETGICPIREELHSECFDEIIRQVTIDCPERGILLMRIRDELKMTINAYKTLYKSAVSFGMRKQMEAEEGKEELKVKAEELRSKKAELEKKKEELLLKKATIERRNEERRAYERGKRRGEIEFLEYQNNHLRQFFQGIDSNK